MKLLQFYLLSDKQENHATQDSSKHVPLDAFCCHLSEWQEEEEQIFVHLASWMQAWTAMG